MLLTEYDPKKHIRQEREDAWNDGNAAGIKTGEKLVKKKWLDLQN